jgi:RND family efflux transporter MFP subunit
MIQGFKVAGLISAIAFIFTACSSDEHKTADTGNVQPISVTVTSPSVSNAQGISVSGKVESVQTAYISTRLMGIITQINIKAGDPVQKGQALATISSQDIQAKRAQAEAMITEAEANLQNASRDLERFTALYKQQSASAKELENITLQYKSAEARVRAAKEMKNEVNAMMGYSTLRAPFSGIVIQKNAEAGSMANPGIPILVIEQSGLKQVSAAIPESEINRIVKGNTAEIDIKSTGKKIVGKVTEINPSSQFTGGQYIVKISIPNADQAGVYSGMYVNVLLPVKFAQAATAESGAIMVPSASLVKKDQLYELFTISNNNTALLRLVRVGKTIGDQVEIVSGLSKDEKYITSADGKLYNGVPVKLK